MTKNECLAALEAVLFASGEPIEIERLCLALESDQTVVCGLLNELGDSLEAEQRGLRLVYLENKVQLCTKQDYADVIRTALETRKTPMLSNTAMEVLAIVAYRQPVTKSYIEQVRGVDSAYTVGSLCDKGLIEEAGRLEVPGRPILYKTTDNFLRVFGFSSIKELSPLPDGFSLPVDEAAEAASAQQTLEQ
ncbi:MAG: SMC-Scp complex subunit ScpB [Clostridia bacterium]|nr:SMC-Scp complex subunit ScpB [Clostridia bacterium]